MNVQPCPCSSGKAYETCCKPVHLGKPAETAQTLMRARYSAYALNKPDFIVETTHPLSPHYAEDKFSWKRSLTKFSTSSSFERLEIIASTEQEKFASVTFIAHITQDGRDVSFTEKSYFEKVKGKWLYKTGVLKEGHAPTLLTTQEIKILPLAYLGEPVLTKKAEPIEKITEDTRTLIAEMTLTMDAFNGIGLAAPQVHHSIRLFIIRVPHEKGDEVIDFGEVKVFINPTITSFSPETIELSEGCLSIPGIHAPVTRPQALSITYTTLEGKKVEEEITGFQARMIQHEYDHIEGILFPQRLSEKEAAKIKPFLEKLKNRIHDGTEL